LISVKSLFPVACYPEQGFGEDQMTT